MFGSGARSLGATEQMRLRLLCFPEHGDSSAGAAAHARAAAVKVRAIGFLSGATASVFTSEPFHAKAGRRRCVCTVSLLCTTATIYSRLTPRSTCEHLGRRSRHVKKAGRRRRPGRGRGASAPSGLLRACLFVGGGEMKGAAPSTRLSVSAQWTAARRNWIAHFLISLRGARAVASGPSLESCSRLSAPRYCRQLQINEEGVTPAGVCGGGGRVGAHSGIC